LLALTEHILPTRLAKCNKIGLVCAVLLHLLFGHIPTGYALQRASDTLDPRVFAAHWRRTGTGLHSLHSKLSARIVLVRLGNLGDCGHHSTGLFLLLVRYDNHAYTFE